MRLLAFSDWRTQSIDELKDFVNNLSKKPDLILYGGDDVTRFGVVPNEIIVETIYSQIKDDPNPHGFFGYKGFDRKIILWIRAPKIKHHEKKVLAVLNHYSKLKRKVVQVSSIINQEKVFVKAPELMGTIAQFIRQSGSDTKSINYNNLKISRYKDIIIAVFSDTPSSVALNKFEMLAKCSKYGLFGVIGNDCHKIHKSILNGNKVFDLHDKSKKISKYLLVGIEGTTKETELPLGFVLYSENEIKSHLKDYAKKNQPIILLSHCPPYGILDKAIRYSKGQSIGSAAIRSFIEKNNVILHVCGHCHSMGGHIVEFAGCKVLNIASPDGFHARGKIAIIDIIKGEPHINVQELPFSKLSEVYGIGYAYSNKLKEVGINELSELADANQKDLSMNSGIPLKRIRMWQLRARVLVNEEVILIKNFTIKRPIFVDIETDHSQSFIWMICVFEPEKNKIKQFTAHTQNDEKKILSEFVRYLSKNKYNILYSYSGTNFEKRVIFDCISNHRIKIPRRPIFKDILYDIRDILIGPFVNYKLKNLGKFFGFEWKHPEISGFCAPFLYEEYIKTNDKKIIKKLQRYNKDDVLVLWHILKKLRKMEVGKFYTTSEFNVL